jgi:hypothetical protein
MNKSTKALRLARALEGILELPPAVAQDFAWRMIFDVAVARARGAKATAKEVTYADAAA